MELFDDIKNILFLNPRIYDDFIPGENIFLNDIEKYNKFIKDFDFNRPSTGCITVNYLKENVYVKDMTVIGFDFFKSDTWYNPKSFKVVHKTDNEENYIKNSGVTII